MFGRREPISPPITHEVLAPVTGQLCRLATATSRPPSVTGQQGLFAAMLTTCGETCVSYSFSTIS